MALMEEQWSEVAMAFAESIQATGIWQDWNQAQQAMKGDVSLAHLFSRYEELSGAMRNARAQGVGLPGEQMVEFAQVREGIVNDPLYMRSNEASQRLTKLFQDMNSLLTQLLGVDFAAMAAPRSSCCG